LDLKIITTALLFKKQRRFLYRRLASKPASLCLPAHLDTISFQTGPHPTKSGRGNDGSIA
jgi:hypothetical protein